MDIRPDAWTQLTGRRLSRRVVVGVALGTTLLAQTSAGLDGEEAILLALLNDYRVANGLGPVNSQAQLAAAADRHSQDQAANNFHGHTGSDGSTDLQRVLDAGYTDWAAEAENVYWDSANGGAEAAITSWQNSPGHNQNMLGDYTEVGIARAQGSDGWYWTLVLGRQW